MRKYFYPRTPCGVRRQSIHFPDGNIPFLSTYPVRGTTWGFDGEGQCIVISIHVPRAGYDGLSSVDSSSHRYFYPRTPCGVRLHINEPLQHIVVISIHVPRAGYDLTKTGTNMTFKKFLSTYPVRGTTRLRGAQRQIPRHFYPRTPCGVRLSVRLSYDIIQKISIHVPRAGYDQQGNDAGLERYVFLSTYPVRGTTTKTAEESIRSVISIHVPRAGYDLILRYYSRIASKFLSTYPVRGTTL